MSRSSILILLGVLTILTPFSGLPMSLRALLSVIFGACVVGVGLLMRTSAAPLIASQATEGAAMPVEVVATETKAEERATEPPHEMSAI